MKEVPRYLTDKYCGTSVFLLYFFPLKKTTLLIYERRELRRRDVFGNDYTIFI